MPTRVLIEATTSSDGRDVVYLHVAGYRLETNAPDAARAREIVLELAEALGFMPKELS